MDDGAADFSSADEALVKIVTIRRLATYRALLTKGTDLAGSTTTMRVLRAVDDLADGRGPSVSQVAERLAMEHSNTSRAVDQAVQQGLIEKTPSVADGRRVELILSTRGRLLIRQLNGQREEVHAALMAGWDAGEVNTLALLLEKLADSYRRLLDPQR